MGLHFSKEEFLNRKKKTLNSMKNEGIDALIIFRQESMYWLTGYDTFGYVFFQALVLDQNGNTFPIGTRIKNKDMEDTLNHIKEKGIEAFYNGDIAKKIIN